MIEIALNGVNKYFGANKIFDNITFDLQTGEKVGLIGRNGEGKTTIFKIIAGIEKQNSGIVTYRKGIQIGYMEQIPEYPLEVTVEDVLKTPFEEHYKIERELRDIEGSMANVRGKELEDLMKKYSRLQERFEFIGGYEIEEKINKMCTGLKFDQAFRSMKFSLLSGGQRGLVNLGRILLNNPDVLLLDEPTNHLDLEVTTWLEEFLKDYKGAVMIISHDRYFLDRVVERIIEIEDGETFDYSGNYSYYVKEKERRLFEEFEAYENQQKKVKAMEDAIKRLRDWGTRGDNNKFFRRAASMQKSMDKIERLKRPTLERAKIGLQFTSDGRTGKDVYVVEGLRKSFGNNLVLDRLDFYLCFGECVGIMGGNGSGKSTFIKILMGNMPYDSGEVKPGSNLKIGYLEQDVTFEDENLSIIETYRQNFIVSEENARRILSRFLFFGRDIDKRVKDLSGGEKSRLKLCILMHQDINMLILDEPTNHLDIDSREMLEEAIAGFNGTVLFISHDRYFINKVVGRLVELEDKKFIHYAGNYDYFKEKKEQKVDQKEKEVKAKPIQAIASVAKEEVQIKKAKVNPYKLKKLEERIAELEAAIGESNATLQSPETTGDYEKLQKICEEKEKNEEELEEVMLKWLEAQEE